MELISCEERLPNIGEPVILYFTEDEIPITGIRLKTHWVDHLAHDLGKSPTHWAPLPGLPKKKRWMPERGDNYYLIDLDGDVSLDTWNDLDEVIRAFLGVYKTTSEAKTMCEKIKAFVTENIGEI